jgi:effector-binding domain-containing protein
MSPSSNLDEKSYMQSFISICNHSKELLIDFENPICNIIKREDILEGDFEKVSFFGIKIHGNFRDCSVEWQEKPGEYMLPPITGDIMKKCLYHMNVCSAL